MASTLKRRARRKVRSQPSTFRSIRKKRSSFRHLCWSMPLLTQLAGMVAGSYPDMPAKTRQLAGRLVQSVIAPHSLTGKLAAVLATAGLNDPLAHAGQQAPYKRSGTDPFLACQQFFAGGKSPITEPRQLQRPLCYDSFAILHNGQTRTPVFVAQVLNKRSVNAADQPRTNRFFADARLPRAERAELGDYKNSGYSRGHMAPAGDMPNPTAMAQSFSLANMIPQSPQHNGGAWSKVERDTRKYVLRTKGNVYVITGPVYSHGDKSIGVNRVGVPDYVFKLVYDESSQRVWAHWHANDDRARAAQPIGYRELVRRTGIEFLPGSGL